LGPSEFPSPFAEWRRKPIAFVGYSGLSMEERRLHCQRAHNGPAMGARDIAGARRVAWTAAGVAAAMLGAIGLIVTISADL
jgi:hypothetical protein